MKTLIIFFGLFISFSPTMIFAQNEYLDFNFEQSESKGKSIGHWENKGDVAILSIDTTNSSSGKNCLFVRINRSIDGASYYMVLPKVYYQGLRTIEISVNVKMPYEKPNAGLWCSIHNNKEYVGGGSTYNGNMKFPILPDVRLVGKYIPVMPFSWTPYRFEVKTDKDPTEVMIGIYVSKDRAWFDDIKININGKPINDLVFNISQN
ncbi:MAG: hypothetical protein HXX18_08885 [Bacteroidetes bacterium]|nr:hypothetical protein [Bacteroidota bacterium]